MKFFYLNGRFERELCEKFLSFLNENVNESITLYLESYGGLVANAEIMSDAIERHGKVRMVATNYIGSSAFKLFFTTSCERVILPETRGLWHLESFQVSMTEKCKPEFVEDKFVLKNFKKLRGQSTLSVCRSVGMDERDIKKVMEGKDVWFDYSQLQQFLENARKAVDEK